MHVLTSDDYFRDLAPEVRFDVAFIDGLHTYEQTYTDVCNALRHCPDGAVLVDDVVPSDEVSAMRDQDESYARRAALGLAGVPWHGDVFRVVLCLNDHHPELDFVTLTDGGNPQLLLWRREQGVATQPVEASTLASYASIDYVEVFGNGLPDSFSPTSEEAGLSKAINALQRTRTPTHRVE